MSTIFVPAEPYPKKANDNIRSSDWNAAIDEVSRLSVTTQNLDRDTFNGPLTISGALTVNGGLTDEGALTVNGFLDVSEYARISSGNWAVFGANMFNVGAGWALVNYARPGAALSLSGDTPQFNFRVLAGSNLRSIATIGDEGLTVPGGIKGPITVNGNLTVTGVLTASGGINGPITVKGALTVDAALTVTGALTAGGGLTVTGDETVSGKLTVNGPAPSELKGPVTVSGLLTASAGLTVNVALLTANKGLTVNGGVLTASGGLAVTGNETVSGGLTVTGDETVSGKLTVNGTTLSELKGPVTVSGLLTAGAGLTVTGGLTVSGGITGPLTVKGDLTIQGVATVDGLSMSISETTVLATSATGPWASFGSNAYYRGNQWKLAKTAQAGVCLVMSSGGGANRQFAFCRMEANSTTATDLVTIGTGGLTVTGDETVSGKLTVNGTVLSELKGPVTVSGLLTASNGLTVTGNQTVSGGLTVSGALTASGGINGSLTVNGVLKVGSTGGMLEVGSLTTISQNTGGNWAAFGKNLYIAENGTWPVKDTSKPGVNFHMSADGADNKEFRFVRRDVGSTENILLATIGTGGLTVTGGINGPITVKGDLTIQGVATVGGSFMSISETTVLSTNATNGPWASFGSNAYYHGNQWKLANTAQPGVCLQMSGQGGGNSEFRFARVEANSTTATNLVTMGREGIVVHDGKKVVTAGGFLYIIWGRIGTAGQTLTGGDFTARRTSPGVYQIDFTKAFLGVPFAVASLIGSEDSSTLDNALIVRLAADSMTVKTGNSAGVAREGTFTFIAVGSR